MLLKTNKPLVPLYQAVFAYAHYNPIHKRNQPEHHKKQNKRQYKQNSGHCLFLHSYPTLSGCAAARTRLLAAPVYCSDNSVAISVAFFNSSIS